MTKADAHALLVSLYGKEGGKKDLNKDTVIIIDLRRTLVAALQNHWLTPRTKRRVGKQCHLLAIILCIVKLSVPIVY